MARCSSSESSEVSTSAPTPLSGPRSQVAVSRCAASLRPCLTSRAATAASAAVRAHRNRSTSHRSAFSAALAVMSRCCVLESSLESVCVSSPLASSTTGDNTACGGSRAAAATWLDKACWTWRNSSFNESTVVLSASIVSARLSATEAMETSRSFCSFNAFFSTEDSVFSSSRALWSSCTASASSGAAVTTGRSSAGGARDSEGDREAAREPGLLDWRREGGVPSEVLGRVV
mmetsp:Transcript_26877/g.63916  ORF Transcript_26877/g.63916 Transcript_26877/m.63916 type:complete len:232 (-) Transcript_26877:1546-2241(-)